MGAPVHISGRSPRASLGGAPHGPVVWRGGGEIVRRMFEVPVEREVGLTRGGEVVAEALGACSTRPRRSCRARGFGGASDVGRCHHHDGRPGRGPQPRPITPTATPAHRVEGQQDGAPQRDERERRYSPNNWRGPDVSRLAGLENEFARLGRSSAAPFCIHNESESRPRGRAASCIPSRPVRRSGAPKSSQQVSRC